MSPDHHRQRIGLRLMREYVSRLEHARTATDASYERVILIAHKHLIPFYQKCGFEYLGSESPVVHGSQPWYEMRLVLGSGSGQSPPRPTTPTATTPSVEDSQQTGGQNLPPGVWEALNRPSSSTTVAAQPLSAFENGISDVIMATHEENASTNKFDLICPRPGCGSLILKTGVAKLVEKAGEQVHILGLSALQ